MEVSRPPFIKHIIIDNSKPDFVLENDEYKHLSLASSVLAFSCVTTATNELPVGYRFEPEDDELISHYLLRKVWNQPQYNAPIYFFDLYGDYEPWKLFKSTPSKNCLYFYTNLKKKSEKSSKRINRRAGCGTWKGQTKGTDIYNKEGKHIGNKKLFTFEAKTVHGYNYIMHEYSLAGDSTLDGLQNLSTDVVLCRIKRKVNNSTSTTPSLRSKQDDVDLDSIEWID